MCFTYLIFVDQIQKDIWVFLIVFGKSFVFAKISKISKTMLPCSGDLVTGQSSRMPSVTSLRRRVSRLTGWSMSQSRKRLRKFSKILGFLQFSWLSLVTCLRVEAPVARLYRNFRGSLRDLLVSGPFSCKKNLEKIFKNFVSKMFGGLSWRLVHDSVHSRKMCVLRF